MARTGRTNVGTKTRAKRFEFNRLLWNMLAIERQKVGVTQTAAARFLGIDNTSMYRIEKYGTSQMAYLEPYAKFVLRKEVTITFPGGLVTLKPLPENTEVTLKVDF